MKRLKWLFLAILIIIVAIGILLISREMNTTVIERSDTSNVSTEAYLAEDADGVIQLSAPAKDEEEAKKIAQLYGIDYIGYYREYGQYETTKDYNELKELGEENNYPDLEIIYKSFTK